MAFAGRLLRLSLPAAALAMPPLGGHAEPGDAARGERVFQRCYACHSVEPNEPAGLQGPSLYRVLGRPAAMLPDFDYSDAMRQRGAAGLVWDAATLESYIAAPERVVPGTRMSIPPLRDAQDRADLVAYLAQSGPYSP